MQKKILWGVAALVLLFVFAGCSQPTDYTIKTGKIENPGSLKATVYEGLVLLTWTPVADAEEYQIWRSYSSDKTQPQNKPPSNVYLDKITVPPQVPGTALAYLDFVSWTNQLRDKEDYEYTVISVSSKDTSLNGSSKVKTKPNIPAALTATLGGVEVGGGAVTITNGQPNLKYTIAQTYGNAAITRKFEKNNITAQGQWYNSVIRQGLLPIKGKYTVTVKGAWAGTDSYYSGGGEWSQTFDEPVAGGIFVKNFSATRNGIGDAEVDFVWESNGSTFAIYKAELSEESKDPGKATNDTDTPPDGKFDKPGEWGSIEVKSDWTAVSITAAQDNELLGGKWRAKETGLASVQGKYIYAIVVDDGADYGFDSVGDWPITVPNNFVAKVAAYGDDEVVLLTWNDAGEGVTYKLERSEITDYTASPLSFKLVGDFVNITPSTLYYLGAPNNVGGSSSTVDARRAVVEDKPATGKEYIYKLTVTKNGASDYDIAFISYVGKFPGVSFSFGGFASILSSTSQHATNLDAKNITLKLDVTVPASPNNKADKDYPITLYRRLNNYTPFATVNNNYESAFATVGTGLKFDKDATTWTYKDTLPELNKKYTYLLSINDQWFIFDEVQALGSSVYENVYSYNSYTGAVTANMAATQTAITQSNATTKPNLPPWSIIIASGTADSGNAVPTNDSWTGPNITGLTASVRYKTSAATPVDTPYTVTVGVVTATVAPVAPATNTVVEYYYYITLPADAALTGALEQPGATAGSWTNWLNY